MDVSTSIGSLKRISQVIGPMIPSAINGFPWWSVFLDWKSLTALTKALSKIPFVKTFVMPCFIS